MNLTTHALLEQKRMAYIQDKSARRFGQAELSALRERVRSKTGKPNGHARSLPPTHRRWKGGDG